MSRNQAASANHLFQMKGLVPVHAHELSKDLLGKEEWLLTNGSLYVSAGGPILLSAIGGRCLVSRRSKPSLGTSDRIGPRQENHRSKRQSRFKELQSATPAPPGSNIRRQKKAEQRRLIDGYPVQLRSLRKHEPWFNSKMEVNIRPIHREVERIVKRRCRK